MLSDFSILGAWVFITLLPTLTLNNKKEDRPICTRDYIGWVLWALGFFFEVVADHQKSVFKSNPDNAVSYFCLTFTLSFSDTQITFLVSKNS